ncbi:MAG: hypothetical protein IJI83_03055 [Oscillospiraceae bacterium]|nr:hypothetical protein [Oscillospiraceae bacterium]
MPDERNDSFQSGLGTASDAVSGIVNTVEGGKAAKLKGAKEKINSVSEIAKEVIFGGLDPKIMLGLLGVIIVILVIAIFLTTINPSTWFKTDATKQEYISKALKRGFIQKKKDARSYIASHVNSKYNCKGSLASMSSLIDDRMYTYSTEGCEITIDFEPDLETFARHIDAHSVAVNSTLSLLSDEEIEEDNKPPEVPEITEGVVQFDDDNNPTLNEYGEEYIKALNSEYADNQSDSYFDSLDRYSNKIFDYEKDTGEWIYNVELKQKTVYEDVCYIKKNRQGPTTTSEMVEYEKVACSMPHDLKKEEPKTIYVQTGTVTVPMTYDVTMYKKDAIEKLKSSIVGKQTVRTQDDKLPEIVTIENQDEADMFVDGAIASYEMSYLMTFIGDSFGVGYAGLITSNGWNYTVTTNDSGVTALFWAYSRGLNAALHNLLYATDNTAFGPTMTNQCTQFAATFFYDVYGFAALRGDGSRMADYLLKDCGSGSACPVQFERSSGPAPGAIISLYPNHVVVVDQVDEDGTVYISEGNYNGNGGIRTHQKYNGLSDFAAKTGYAIKTIAIPKQ